MDKRKKMDVYAFPAVFEIDDDDGGVVNVTFPDIENCFTNADCVEEAAVAAKEALENVLYWTERDGRPIPSPTEIRSIKCSAEQFTSLVTADMRSARRAWENRSVSRTITLPAWLDELARQSNLNFSQVLQQAVKKTLGVKNKLRVA